MNVNGLSVVGSFIIGFDGEKKGVGKRICALVEETAIPTVMINTLGVIPNTRLWERLKQEGRLLENIGGEDITNRRSLNYVPTRPRSEIIEEWRQCQDYLYEPSRYLARSYRYYLRMRPTRRALAALRGDSKLPSVRSHKDPVRRRLLAFRALLYLIWTYGIVHSSRLQFWKQLIGIRRKNPSRFVKYMLSLLFGDTVRRLILELRPERTLLRDIQREPAEACESGQGVIQPRDSRI
jgi:hypothetical protein